MMPIERYIDDVNAFLSLRYLHDVERAIMEASSIADLDRNADAARVDSRTASFCFEKSGHDDLWTGAGKGDQGEDGAY